MITNLKKNYFMKLGSNFFSLIANTVIMLIVPKALGPIGYGSFNFLTDLFNNFIIFFNLSTNMAFYTKVSKNPGDYKLIKYYSIFIIFTFIFTFLFLIIALLFFKELFFPSQKKIYILMAFIYSILFFLLNHLRGLNDAQGLTFITERWIVFQKFLTVLIILFLSFRNLLDLKSFFITHYISIIFLLITWLIIRRTKSPPQATDNGKSFKSYFNFFQKYSKPLFYYNILGIICVILDRYLLQLYGGGYEQGYYSIALRFSVFILMFTSAMTPLFTRELSIYHKEKDNEGKNKLFELYLRLFYIITSTLSLFLMFNGKLLLSMFGGEVYMEGLNTFYIMCLYPIHQTYGQLNASLFYASENTATYSKIGISFMLLGVLTTFFLLNPDIKIFDINQSLGLAIKIVVINIFSVNTLLWINTKILRISFIKLLSHQIFIFLILIVINLFLGSIISLFSLNEYVRFILYFLLYISIIIYIVFNFPSLIKVEKVEIKNFLKSLTKL